LILLSIRCPILTLIQALDDDDNLIGVIVCKLEPHRGGPMRGYIAMLATRKDYRGHGIATSLVKMAIEKMIVEDADEVKQLGTNRFAKPCNP
jgi:ribosomal protein S18 acetylase RimI-like enzyme